VYEATTVVAGGVATSSGQDVEPEAIWFVPAATILRLVAAPTSVSVPVESATLSCVAVAVKVAGAVPVPVTSNTAKVPAVTVTGVTAAAPEQALPGGAAPLTTAVHVTPAPFSVTPVIEPSVRTTM
jgi:hypothetical protein